MTIPHSILASMNRLAQDITGIRTAVTMKRELEAHRERERSLSGQSHHEEDEKAREIMDSFQEHVGPSLSNLAVSVPQVVSDGGTDKLCCRMWREITFVPCVLHFCRLELDQSRAR